MRTLQDLGSFIRRGARKGVRTVFGKATANRDIKALAAESDGGIRKIADALSDAVEGRGSAEERAWIRKIEGIRARMLVSEEPIRFVDFGAGSSPGERDAALMDQGVVSMRTVRDVCGASKAPKWASLLFHLVRKFQPETCLELGTCVGVSAAYQSAALALNQKGRLLTLEGADAMASVARSNLRELGLDRCEVVVGRFKDTLGDVLQRHPRLDYAFIDGHHDEEATKRYFQQIKPHLTDGALVLFDDIPPWSPGMRRAWEAIESDPRVLASIDAGLIGLCVVSESPRGSEKRFRVRLPF